MNKILTLFFLLSLALLSALAQAENRLSLNYFTEQFPPYNYVKNGTLTGISVDLLQQVWLRMRLPKQNVEVLEWDRAYYLLQQQRNSVVFMTMKTPLRLSLFKWACPIYKSKVLLIGLKYHQFEVNNFEQAKQYMVAATRGAVGEQLLINQGFPYKQIVATANLEQGIKYLTRNRVDFVVSELEAVHSAAKGLGISPEQFAVKYQVAETEGCFAFNKAVPDEFIAEFERHLTAIVGSPLYDELLQRHDLEPW